MHTETNSVIDEFAHGMRIVGPAELVGGLGSQLPGWYARRLIGIREAAKILSLDTSTLREQARKGVIRGRKTAAGWVFGVRDISDYIAGGHWHGTRSVKPWSQDDIKELLETGQCRGRTKAACKTMRTRLKNGTNQNHSEAV